MAAKVIKIEIPIETQDKTDPALGSVDVYKRQTWERTEHIPNMLKDSWLSI